MSVFLIIMLSIVVQTMLTGSIGSYIGTRESMLCDVRRNGYGDVFHEPELIGHPCNNSRCEHQPNGYFKGFFWPIVIPFMVATKFPAELAARHYDGKTKEERKYEKEVAIANHRADILAIRQKEIDRMEQEVGIK